MVVVVVVVVVVVERARRKKRLNPSLFPSHEHQSVTDRVFRRLLVVDNVAYNNVNTEILDMTWKPSATPGRGTACGGEL
ncbi:hypothetical protein E2C01_042870 [Portunus trituberculatus]|uniref:Uncharacterized protein n=1 Tax=Portunus trituberculatus TaxID=210409 RepID=A0A5B7FUS3_PORTR|nr:hypothetical protein [Portunus trituberculatus]